MKTMTMRMALVCAGVVWCSAARGWALTIHETLKMGDNRYIQMNTNAIQNLGYVQFAAYTNAAQLLSYIGIGAGTNAITGTVYFNAASNTFYYRDVHGAWRPLGGEAAETAWLEYINTLSNYIASTMITSVANYAYLTGQVDDTYVNISGDTMTGLLILSGDPQDALGAVTKQYVDGMPTSSVFVAMLASNQTFVTLLASNNVLVSSVVSNQYFTQVLASNETFVSLLTSNSYFVAGVTNQLDDIYVNESGDTMSGDLNMGGNDILNVNYLEVKNLYAEHETVANLTVTNIALLLTNVTINATLNMAGNQITNLADATRDDMAVTYRQLTNAVGDISEQLIAATNQVFIDARTYVNHATNQTLIDARAYTEYYTGVATNQVLIDARSYTDGATNSVVILGDDRWVNESGDDMTGMLGMGGNRITNLADAVEAQDAVTLGQLDAAVASATNSVTLQQAYANGNEIATSAGAGNVIISGTQGLSVSAAGGVAVSGGSLTVSGAGNHVNVAGGNRVNLNGAAGNDYMTRDDNGIHVYRNGQLVMSYDGD